MAGFFSPFLTVVARWSRRALLGAGVAGVLAGGVAAALPLTGYDLFVPVVLSDNPQQMRIQQHLSIRITPGGPAAGTIGLPPPMMLDDDEAPRPATRLEERKMARCVPVAAIAGAQSGPRDRLVLFLRDSRAVMAVLPKSCRAHDFYSGFYVDRNADGQLCAGRDEIHARSGARCMVDDFRALVEVPVRRGR